MRVRKLSVLGVSVLLAAVPAMAAITPGQPNGGEPPLYEIYNDIYGTSYTGNDDVNFLSTQTGRATITLDSDGGSISFATLWRQAYLEDEVGYYTSSNSKVTLNMVPVLGPYDNSDPNQGQGAIVADPVVVDATGLGTIGFYDHASYPGAPSTYFNWFSESYLNDGQWQTTPGEVHVLILTTPDADTYLLCFEDLPYTYLVDGNAKQQDIGDQDYQDILVQITLNRTVVPEPRSLVLLGLGLAAVAYRKIRARA